MLPIHNDQSILRIAAPYVTWGTILLCVIVQVWLHGQTPRGEAIASYTFGFIPATFLSELPRSDEIDLMPTWSTLVTYQYLHAGVGHLLGNMVALFVFGGLVEDRFGHPRYAVLYLVSGMVAGLAHWLAFPESQVVLVGASGAVAGVSGAFLILFPKARITLLGPLFIPLRLRAWVVILVWLLVQVYMVSLGGDSNVAWLAHIAGFAVGAAAGAAVRFTEQA